MAARRITVDGRPRDLPAPFFCIGSIDPGDPVAEALTLRELDRWAMAITIGHRDRGSELRILDEALGGPRSPSVQAVVSPEVVDELQRITEAVTVAPPLRAYLVELVAATRSMRGVRVGVSSRGLVALGRTARTQAAAAGRGFVTADDVKRLASAVLEHRMGAEGPAAVHELLRSVSVPNRG